MNAKHILVVELKPDGFIFDIGNMVPMIMFNQEAADIVAKQNPDYRCRPFKFLAPVLTVAKLEESER